MPWLTAFAAFLVVFAQQAHGQAGIPVFYDFIIGEPQVYRLVKQALEEADYVENREERQQINEQLNSDRSAASTTSNSSVLLTRNVTLGDQDLYLAYIEYQLALEWARRNAVDELARVYCEQISGRIGCSTNPYYQNPDVAYVVDPIAWKNEEYSEGVLGVLESGTAEDQAIRNQRIADRSNPYLRQKPRAYSYLIAELRDRAALLDAQRGINPDNPQSASSKVKQVLAAAVSQYGFQSPSVTALDNITYKVFGSGDNQKIEPTFSKAVFPTSGKQLVSAEEFINSYLDSAEDISQLVGAVSQELERGAEFIRTYKEVEETDGILANTGLVAQRYIPLFEGASVRIGEIKPYVKTPAQTKIGLSESLATTIGTLDSNVKFAQGVGFPGTDKLVPPPGERLPFASDNENSSGVAGAQAQAQESGVAGIFDVVTGNESATPNYSAYYDQVYAVQNRLAINPVAPHREEGVQDALRALTGDTYRKDAAGQCGFCGFLSDVISNSPFWSQVVARINQQTGIQ